MLVIGAILTTGKRTVSAVLRVMGLSQERNYPKYHQVLSRAAGSGLILLRVLLRTFAKVGEPLVFGIDETIEQRRGGKIKAKGIYRDPVRSRKEHCVKASGLRWISVMWLTAIPWAQCLWALPFLTVLAPSERYYEAPGRKPKKITDWARQLIIVGDNAYAALDFLNACQTLKQLVTVITRLRLDAALYEPPPPYCGRGRPRKKGKRLPTLQHRLNDEQTVWQRLTVPWYNHMLRPIEIVTGTACWFHFGLPGVHICYVLIRDVAGKFDPQALLSPEQILAFFMRRWQMEPTFRHVREHLGVETQRQWSDKAIARTTPVLLGLFSLITRMAHSLFTSRQVPIRTAAWYPKPLSTFSDALALVRYHLCAYFIFQMSTHEPEMIKLPRSLVERFNELLCFTT